MSSTKEIFDNFLNEAETGLVVFPTTEGSAWKFGVNFYSNIEGKSNAIDNSVPELQIPNYDKFVEELDEYLALAKPFYEGEKSYFDLTDESYTKKLMSDLFASATNYDFQNFLPYLQTRTKQLQNTLQQDQFELGNLNGATIFAKIKKNSSNLEGPYNMEFYAQKKKEIYPLPSVTFGISDNNVHLYAIKNTNIKITDPATKKSFSTVVDGNSALDTKFKEDMQKYFHSITLNSHAKGIERNVSPNSLVSLALFLSFFKKTGIKEIVAPDFMPIRYATNRSAICNKSYNDKESLDERLERHDNDQMNITNKFMHLFLRYNRSFPECEIGYDDLRQEMHMTLSQTKSNGENLIYKIDRIGSEPETDILSK